ncbi:MAG: cytochrome c maturation protein CcmE [Chloroflexota bacterium]
MSSTGSPVTAIVARRRGFPLHLAPVAVVLLAIVYLVVTGLSTAATYYLTVSEFQAQQAQGPATDRPVRVSGHVVPGSIVRDGATVRFTVADGSGSLPVIYQGIVPDIFGENIQVVVEGRGGGAVAFQAETLLAKCPSKFEAAPAAGPSA